MSPADQTPWDRTAGWRVKVGADWVGKVFDPPPSCSFNNRTNTADWYLLKLVPEEAQAYRFADRRFAEHWVAQHASTEAAEIVGTHDDGIAIEREMIVRLIEREFGLIMRYSEYSTASARNRPIEDLITMIKSGAQHRDIPSAGGQDGLEAIQEFIAHRQENPS